MEAAVAAAARVVAATQKAVTSAEAAVNQLLKRSAKCVRMGWGEGGDLNGFLSDPIWCKG